MKDSTKKEVYSWIKTIVVAALIALICRHFLFTPVTVYGKSMEPTFQENNRVVVSKTSEIGRFDIIVFKAPDRDEQYIKRVIGMPGDRVEMQDDVLYVNGNPYEESYIKGKDEAGVNRITGNFTLDELTGTTIVPEGYFFVLGDNRLKSKDSRDFGFISADAVVGKVKFRFFPFEKMGMPK
ncbi:signal peptidase I [Sporosarcina luteola]|nr:signal peptidase I [Sporosarcina luteola]